MFFVWSGEWQMEGLSQAAHTLAYASACIIYSIFWCFEVLEHIRGQPNKHLPRVALVLDTPLFREK